MIIDTSNLMFVIGQLDPIQCFHLVDFWQIVYTGIRWMKRKSSFVSDIARLAKFWSQSVLYIGCGSGKSFLIELIVVKSALETESSSISNDKYRDAFEAFLEKMINLKTLNIVFEDLEQVNDVSSDILKERPLVLNPVNHYQNVMEVAEDRFIEAKNMHMNFFIF